MLAFAAVVSWFVGGFYGGGNAQSTQYVTIALMVIAFLKVRLVITHFMETKVAPLGLRMVADVYVFGVCGLVLYMYFRV